MLETAAYLQEQIHALSRSNTVRAGILVVSLAATGCSGGQERVTSTATTTNASPTTPKTGNPEGTFTEVAEWDVPAFPFPEGPNKDIERTIPAQTSVEVACVQNLPVALAPSAKGLFYKIVEINGKVLRKPLSAATNSFWNQEQTKPDSYDQGYPVDAKVPPCR